MHDNNMIQIHNIINTTEIINNFESKSHQCSHILTKLLMNFNKNNVHVRLLDLF